MGNNSLSPHDYDIAIKFDMQDWVKEAVYPKYQLWKHKQTLEQVQVYSLSEVPSIADMNIYQFRSKTSDIVKIYKINLDEDNSVCTTCHPQLLVQHIPFRLYNVNYLNINEALTVLCAVLRAYHLMNDFCGTAQPNQQLIGFNQQGKPKIWLNKQFNLNNLPTANSLNQSAVESDKYIKNSIPRIIKKIYEMVEQRSAFKLLPLFIRPLFFRNCKSYKSALGFLQQYSLKNNINLNQSLGIDRLIQGNDREKRKMSRYQVYQVPPPVRYIQNAILFNTKGFQSRQRDQLKRIASQSHLKRKSISYVPYQASIDQKYVNYPAHNIQTYKIIVPQKSQIPKINFIQNNQVCKTFIEPSPRNSFNKNYSSWPSFIPLILSDEKNVISGKQTSAQMSMKQSNLSQKQQKIQNINFEPIKESNIAVAQHSTPSQQSQQQSPRFCNSDSEEKGIDSDQQKDVNSQFIDSKNKEGQEQDQNQDLIGASPYFNISPSLTNNCEKFHQFISYTPSEEKIPTEKQIPSDHLVTFKKVQFRQDFIEAQEEIPSSQNSCKRQWIEIPPHPEFTSVESRLEVVRKQSIVIQQEDLKKQIYKMHDKSIERYIRYKYNLNQQEQSQDSQVERQQQQQDVIDINYLQKKLDSNNISSRLYQQINNSQDDEYINKLDEELQNFTIKKANQTAKRSVNFIEQQKQQPITHRINRIKSCNMDDFAKKYEKYALKKTINKSHESSKWEYSTGEGLYQNKSSRQIIQNQSDKKMNTLNGDNLLSDRCKKKTYLKLISESRKKSRGISYEQLRTLLWK